MPIRHPDTSQWPLSARVTMVTVKHNVVKAPSAPRWLAASGQRPRRACPGHVRASHPARHVRVVDRRSGHLFEMHHRLLQTVYRGDDVVTDVRLRRHYRHRLLRLVVPAVHRHVDLHRNGLHQIAHVITSPHQCRLVQIRRRKRRVLQKQLLHADVELRNHLQRRLSGRVAHARAGPAWQQRFGDAVVLVRRRQVEWRASGLIAHVRRRAALHHQQRHLLVVVASTHAARVVRAPHGAVKRRLAASVEQVCVGRVVLEQELRNLYHSVTGRQVERRFSAQVNVARSVASHLCTEQYMNIFSRTALYNIRTTFVQHSYSIRIQHGKKRMGYKKPRAKWHHTSLLHW